MYGAQGQYGAMLPPVQVAKPNFFQSLVGYNPNKPLQTTAQYPAWNAFSGSVSNVFQQAVGLKPIDTSKPPPIPTLPSPGTYYNPDMAQKRPDIYQQMYANYAMENRATPPSFGFSPTAGMMNIIHRIAEHPEEFNNLPPAQQDAVQNFLERPGQGGAVPTNKGDFYGYERDPETGRSVRVVKNAATGGDLLKELRWDPSKKKYVQVGTLLKQGKLDLKGRTHKGKRQRMLENQARAQAPAAAAPAAPQVQQVNEGFVGGFGVVQFNTGTG
jgi:hypothetical protein